MKSISSIDKAIEQEYQKNTAEQLIKLNNYLLEVPDMLEYDSHDADDALFLSNLLMFGNILQLAQEKGVAIETVIKQTKQIEELSSKAIQELASLLANSEVMTPGTPMALALAALLLHYQTDKEKIFERANKEFHNNFNNIYDLKVAQEVDEIKKNPGSMADIVAQRKKTDSNTTKKSDDDYLKEFIEKKPADLRFGNEAIGRDMAMLWDKLKLESQTSQEAKYKSVIPSLGGLPVLLSQNTDIQKLNTEKDGGGTFAFFEQHATISKVHKKELPAKLKAQKAYQEFRANFKRWDEKAKTLLEKLEPKTHQPDGKVSEPAKIDGDVSQNLVAEKAVFSVTSITQPIDSESPDSAKEYTKSDTTKVDLATEKYQKLQAHLGDVRTCFEEVSANWYQPEKRKAAMQDLRAANTALRDEKIFRERQNPKKDRIVDDVIELTGVAVRVAVGLLSFGLSETNSSIGSKITDFFKPKANIERKAEELAKGSDKVISSAEETPEVPSTKKGYTPPRTP